MAERSGAASPENIPFEASLARLTALGVDYAVVHIDLYPAGEWPAVDARLRQFEDRLTLVYSSDTARIYALNQ